MNEKLIGEALVLAESYINDGKELPNDPNHPYYKTSEAVEQALASLDAEKVEYCEWERRPRGIYLAVCGRQLYGYPDGKYPVECPVCGKPIRIKETTN